MSLFTSAVEKAMTYLSTHLGHGHATQETTPKEGTVYVTIIV